MKQVAIVGLGLIGCSLGLALRRGPKPPQVIGFDVSKESLHRAARLGAIDRSCGTLPELCQDSDVIVIATPVRGVIQLIPDLAPHLAPDALLTDTGGTKREILRVAESILPRPLQFVGGHPLAGPLTAGVAEPNENLFNGTMYCLTTSPHTAEWAVAAAIGLVEAVGAQPHFVDADEHDGLLAGISHLPYFAAASLINAVSSQSSWEEMGAMAAGGFRSASAPADSDPEVWADVAATNRENVLRQLDAMIEHLTRLRGMIESGDDRLRTELNRAQQVRKAWLARRS